MVAGIKTYFRTSKWWRLSSPCCIFQDSPLPACQCHWDDSAPPHSSAQPFGCPALTSPTGLLISILMLFEYAWSHRPWRPTPISLPAPPSLDVSAHQRWYPWGQLELSWMELSSPPWFQKNSMCTWSGEGPGHAHPQKPSVPLTWRWMVLYSIVNSISPPYPAHLLCAPDLASSPPPPPELIRKHHCDL